MLIWMQTFGKKIRTPLSAVSCFIFARRPGIPPCGYDIKIQMGDMNSRSCEVCFGTRPVDMYTAFVLQVHTVMYECH